MEHVAGEGYEIRYNSATTTIEFCGSLRLLGASSYAPIIEFLDKVLAQSPQTITLNLHELKFLNSSGINTLSKFIIKVREQQLSEILIQGSEKFPWQVKSLRNLQRLMPDLCLEIITGGIPCKTTST